MASEQKTKLTVGLVVLFLSALVMGAGPGIYLINRPETISVLGLKLPLLYAWALFWYGILASCIVAAYFLMWRGIAAEEES